MSIRVVTEHVVVFIKYGLQLNAAHVVMFMKYFLQTDMVMLQVMCTPWRAHYHFNS